MFKNKLRKNYKESIFKSLYFVFFVVFAHVLSAQNSPLSSGVWRKVLVNKHGMHQISGATMKSWGWNLSNISPNSIKIFGNHGGMLPEANDVWRPTNLLENAIFVNDGGDGVFNEADYISFYAEGPHKFLFDSIGKQYVHQNNIYSDVTAYFITFGGADGKRINAAVPPVGSPTVTYNTYDFKYFYEKDVNKILHSGREFHGEDFSQSGSKTFPVNVVAPVDNATVKLKLAMAGKGISSTAVCSFNGQNFATISGLYGIEDNIDAPKYTEFLVQNNLKINSSSNNIQVYYNKGGDNSVGYLNYFEFFTDAYLANQGFFEFSKIAAINENLVQYSIDNQGKAILVLDITNPWNLKSMPLQTSGNTSNFVAAHNGTFRKFVCLDWTKVESVTDGGGVDPQNLASLPAPDLVILTHPEFVNAAQVLANHRRSHDGLSVAVVTPQQVYNEFSSGTQDITAIRDFMKKLYDDGSNRLKYLLIMGDASYDYKNRIANNTNFVPTYESFNSDYETKSYCSDDYYCFLEDADGYWPDNKKQTLEISIGRLPVQNAEEANKMVEKLIRYDSPKAFGSWRNTFNFLADDVDESWDVAHVYQTEAILNVLDTSAPVYNSTKIYMDAYKEVLLGGAGAYPEVNRKVDEVMNQGTLVFNYIGHGGTAGMAKERVVSIEQINKWNNLYHMPIFVTATCELAAYDNPAVKSAGEHMILNPTGGPIALFTTTRVVYSANNFVLSQALWLDNMADEGLSYRLGDVYLRTKNRTSINENDRRFTILGDPSMLIARPKNKVILDSINDLSVSQHSDTIKALSLVVGKGHLEKSSGGLWSNFNGEVDVVIYDKPISETTLGNGDNGVKIGYKHLKSIIYKGKVIAENGRFSFSFIVPKDISYNIQLGKFSFYAQNAVEDGNGYNRDIYIGGSSDTAADDDIAPTVTMFLNTRKFINGGVTDENPYFIADLFDDHGINLSLSGVGRTLLLTIDKGTADEKEIILNDYYTSKTGTYKEGSIGYQFNNLKPGRHHLHLKVWDTYNNSGEGELYFIVGEVTNEFKVLALRSVPNPFQNAPKIIFDHNRPGTDLTIKTELFSNTGAMVLNHTQTIQNCESTLEVAVDNDENWVNYLKPGLYILRFTVTTSNGEKKTETLKIVYTP